jgi:hypothetical protein
MSTVPMPGTLPVRTADGEGVGVADAAPVVFDATPADTPLPHAVSVRNEPAAASRTMVDTCISILSEVVAVDVLR